MTQQKTGATTGEPVLDPEGQPIRGQLYVPNLEAGGPGFAPIRGVGYFLDGAGNPTGSAYAGLGTPLDPTATLWPGTWSNGNANGVALFTVAAPGAGFRLYLAGILITYDSATSTQLVNIVIGNLQGGNLTLGFTVGATVSGSPPFVLGTAIPTATTNQTIPVTANFLGAVPPYTGTTAVGNGGVNLIVVTRQG